MVIDEILNLDFSLFPENMSEWIEMEVRDIYNPRMILKILFLYFNKMLEDDLQVDFPALEIDYIKIEKNYFNSHLLQFYDILETAANFLFLSLVDWSSFEIEIIDLTSLEDLLDVDIEVMMGWDDEIRKSMIVQSWKQIFSKNQEKLFEKLPNPVLDCIDFPYNRQVFYLFNRKLAAYLQYAKENNWVILSGFKEEHYQLLRALKCLKHPISNNWINAYIHEGTAYVMGFCMGSDIENSISFGNFNWNFFVAFYAVEKLLEAANDRFHFY